jgi:hypothetical protein
MAIEDLAVTYTVSATLTFSFERAKIIPQLIEGYTSSEFVFNPYSDRFDPCVNYYHSYGIDPISVNLTGLGHLIYVGYNTELFQEELTFDGSSVASLSQIPISNVLMGVESRYFEKITETFNMGEITYTASSFSPVLKYNSIANEISVSDNPDVLVKYYGKIVVKYNVHKNTYKVSFKGIPCYDFAGYVPTTSQMGSSTLPSGSGNSGVTVTNASYFSGGTSYVTQDNVITYTTQLTPNDLILTNENYTLAAIFLTGISTISGKRNQNCCARPTYAGGVVTGVSGDNNEAFGCTTVVSLYGDNPDSVSDKNNNASVGYMGYSKEGVIETLEFNGSTSVSLKYIPIGIPSIIEKSDFESIGTYANGSGTSNVPHSGLGYNPFTNSYEIIPTSGISNAQFFGTMVIGYESERYDYAVTFSQNNCPENTDTEAERKRKEDLSKAFLVITWGPTHKTSLTVSRDSSCCPKQKPGKSIESYTVKVEHASFCNSFKSKKEVSQSALTGYTARVDITDYILVHNFGEYDFDLDAYTIEDGTFGKAKQDSGGESSVGEVAKALDISFSKVFRKEVLIRQQLSLKESSTATLDGIPKQPNWKEIVPLKSILPQKYELYVCFGVKTEEVYTGEYNYSTHTFNITGVKQLKANEVCIVNSLNIEMLVSGVIEVSYYTTICIYEIMYTLGSSNPAPSVTESRYRISFVSDDIVLNGECKSDIKSINVVSKKKLNKSFKEFFDSCKTCNP